ncbi:MAG TPA: hypothetical protein VH500_25895 [Nitrososphaeraceae archaeon]
MTVVRNLVCVVSRRKEGRKKEEVCKLATYTIPIKEVLSTRSLWNPTGIGDYFHQPTITDWIP